MLSNSEAVVPSMNVFATVFVAMRDRIFFCARNPISRALNALSVMTGMKKEAKKIPQDEKNKAFFVY